MAKKAFPVIKAIKKDRRQIIAGKSTRFSIGGSSLMDVVDQIRSLAQTGQHAPAIDSATQALSTLTGAEHRSALVMMDLLDLRSESYIALGKLDLAMKDAKAMMKMGSKVAGLKVQALNRLALVQMRTGDLKGAIKTANTAVKASANRKSKTVNQKSLHAESLFRLAEAQWRGRQLEAALKTAQQAITLFQELGDTPGMGRSYWVLSGIFFRLSRGEESRRAALTALELCKQAGDSYGIGNALLVLTNTDVDIAEQIQHLQQAKSAFETAGYTDRQFAVMGNLGITYDELGLYPHVRRLQNEVAEKSRSMGAKLGMTYSLGNLLETETTLGELEAARLHLRELETLVLDLGDPGMEQKLFSQRSGLAFAAGDVQTAIRHQKSALKLIKELQINGEHTTLTTLATLYLAAHDPAAALKATSKATALHRAQNFAKPEDFPSQAIWWRHVQALNANRKTKEAREALERAYDFLLESIRNIRDAGLRRNALNKVEDNRNLLKYWVKHAGGRGDSRVAPTTYPHLAIESNLREPFQRLADTGLRLNALHTVERIQTFLVEEATELIGGERVMLILEKDGAREVAESILPLPSYRSGKGYEKAEDPRDVLKRIRKYLDQARQTRTVQLTLPSKSISTVKNSKKNLSGSSILVAPLIAQSQLLGYLYVDMDSLYGSFDNTDSDMLGMLANQGAVALDNAQWAQGLEQKVQERTEQLQTTNAQLEQSNAELAVINSVQKGLASKLDMQEIYNLVGDKIQSIFNAQVVLISTINYESKILTPHYIIAHGERQILEPINFGIAPWKRPIEAMIQNPKPLLIEENAKQWMADHGMDDTDPPKTMLFVPLTLGGKIWGGYFSLQDGEREHAYSPSDIRLLQTLANTMSVALQNAQSFKAEQERVAELAIINSVQEGLASKLDIQEIYNLVGEKIREIFKADTTYIHRYDQKNNSVYAYYYVDRDQRFPPQPLPFGQGLYTRVIKLRKPLLFGKQEEWVKAGGTIIYSPGQNKELNESFLGLPIMLGDEVTGVVSIQSYKQSAFGENDVRLLTTLANAMSVALQNAQSFKAEQERVAELQIINSIQQGLATELDFQAIIDLVGDNLMHVFNTPNLGISWYEESTNLIYTLYAYEKNKRLTVPPLEPTPGGIFETMQETKKPFVIDTVEQWIANFGVALPGTEMAKSSVFAPIISKDKVIGYVIIENHEREYAFGESELRLLTTIAASLGTALENARLFDETQRLLKETEQRAAELAIINSVQQGLASKLEMQAIYDLVGNKIREIFEAQAVVIATFDHSHNMVNYTFNHEKGQRFHAPPVPFNERDRRLIHTGELILINSDAGRRIKELGMSVVPGTEKPKSLLYVPLMAGGAVNGFVSLQNVDRENAFSDSDVRLLQTLASSMSVALENARLFDETQRLLKITEERNDELAVINSVQEGLVAQLDFNAIIHLVGNKLYEIFKLSLVQINIYDPATDLIHTPYCFEEGNLHSHESRLRSGVSKQVIDSKQTLVINDHFLEIARQHGIEKPPAGKLPKSTVSVPLLVKGQVRGVLSLADNDHEHTFTESIVRLVTTLANSMSVALENARLFDETSRLLKITEDRNAELAIINSVQAALAAELNIQGIYEAVGDKIHEITGSEIVMVQIWDIENGIRHDEYSIEKGKRFPISEHPFTPLEKLMLSDLRSGKTIVWNDGM